ncbi:MAG: T9SS type A sorting domain-containing protein, partial [Candidatus Cloacimonetes bacterium]|nr:T9SS type A sorting domain-containing protein [Candidatus Cloacimonadota bacterium]
GLYKIGGTEFSLEAFELIGDIEAEVVNGQLQMACDIGTLTNDENFGEWPNVTNSIGVEMLTAKYSLPAEFLLADLATMSLQFIDKYEIEPIVNTLPQITESNGTNSGIFTCNYFDDNGHFPITAEIVVDGETFQMNPLGFAFSSDVIFESVTGSYGWDEATFRFSDNGYDYVEETIINNSSSDQELLNSDYTLRNYPNPFNPNTTISFELNTTEIDDIYLTIYNLKGQKIKQFSILSNQSSISWNGTNEKDEPVSSGIYLYKLKVNGTDLAKSKCMLLK